jgi:DNA polymerase V
MPELPMLPAELPGVFIPLLGASYLPLPIDEVRVSAGFPSPAAAYADKRLDINEYLVRNPVSTFFFSVEGNSMQGAEIFDGDMLVVDKSIRPRHGHIVIAFVDGQRLVKRLYQRAGRVALLAENSLYLPLEINESMEFLIWGVVTGKFKHFGA